MKKAKIMLLAIAVFAAVGIALAFKVNKVGNSRYCYTLTDSQPDIGVCTFTTTNASMTFIGGENIWFTTTANIQGCANASCPYFAKGIKE